MYGGDLEKVRADLKDMKCEYLLTGGWSSKASQEAARLLGDEYVSIVTDARKANQGKWGIIPEEKEWSFVEKKNSALTYFCDNETVDGVEFPALPKALETEEEGEEHERLVIGDMSSNILSRPVDVKKYAAIFVSSHCSIYFVPATANPRDRLVPKRTLVRLELPLSLSANTSWTASPPLPPYMLLTSLSLLL